MGFFKRTVDMVLYQMSSGSEYIPKSSGSESIPNDLGIILGVINASSA